jgi:hypothetical protein
MTHQGEADRFVAGVDGPIMSNRDTGESMTWKVDALKASHREASCSLITTISSQNKARVRSAVHGAAATSSNRGIVGMPKVR